MHGATLPRNIRLVVDTLSTTKGLVLVCSTDQGFSVVSKLHAISGQGNVFPSFHGQKSC